MITSLKTLPQVKFMDEGSRSVVEMCDLSSTELVNVFGEVIVVIQLTI